MSDLPATVVVGKTELKLYGKRRDLYLPEDATKTDLQVGKHYSLQIWTASARVASFSLVATGPTPEVAATALTERLRDVYESLGALL